MSRLIFGELAKLRGTAVMPATLLLPILHVLFRFLYTVDAPGVNIVSWIASVSVTWAALVLPFVIATAASVVMGVEERNDTWRYLNTTGRPGWAIYTSKVACVVLVALFSSGVHLICLCLAAEGLRTFVPQGDGALALAAVASQTASLAAIAYIGSMAAACLVSWTCSRGEPYIAAFGVTAAGIGIALPLWNAHRIWLVNPWQLAGAAVEGAQAYSAGAALLASGAIAAVALVGGSLHFVRRPPR
jgi:hypothetical protein